MTMPDHRDDSTDERPTGQPEVDATTSYLHREVPAPSPELIRLWVELGKENPWICEADDPPFTIESFHICATMHDLIDRLSQGNWTLGQGFALGDLCFINQIDGAGEWLVIRGELPFESYTYRARNEDHTAAAIRFGIFVAEITVATDEQLRALDY